MIGFLASVISIPSLLSAILLFRFWIKRNYAIASKVVSLSRILLVVYIILQTSANIYSLDELEWGINWLCIGVFLIFGFALIFATHEKFSVPEDTSANTNHNILVACSVAYLTALLLPPFTAISIEGYCADAHQLGARRIIDAINRYKVSENKSPDSLDVLIPTYLSEIPSPKCFSIYDPLVPLLTDTEFLRAMDYSVMMDLIKLRKLDYHLKKCEWIEDDIYSVDLFLIVPTIDLDGKDRYDFSAKSWERIPYGYDECLSYSNPSD